MAAGGSGANIRQTKALPYPFDFIQKQRIKLLNLEAFDSLQKDFIATLRTLAKFGAIAPYFANLPEVKERLAFLNHTHAHLPEKLLLTILTSPHQDALLATPYFVENIADLLRPILEKRAIFSLPNIFTSPSREETRISVLIHFISTHYQGGALSAELLFAGHFDLLGPGKVALRTLVKGDDNYLVSALNLSCSGSLGPDGAIRLRLPIVLSTSLDSFHEFLKFFGICSATSTLESIFPYLISLSTAKNYNTPESPSNEAHFFVRKIAYNVFIPAFLQAIIARKFSLRFVRDTLLAIDRINNDVYKSSTVDTTHIYTTEFETEHGKFPLLTCAALSAFDHPSDKILLKYICQMLAKLNREKFKTAVLQAIKDAITCGPNAGAVFKFLIEFFREGEYARLGDPKYQYTDFALINDIATSIIAGQNTYGDLMRAAIEKAPANAKASTICSFLKNAREYYEPDSISTTEIEASPSLLTDEILHSIDGHFVGFPVDMTDGAERNILSSLSTLTVSSVNLSRTYNTQHFDLIPYHLLADDDKIKFDRLINFLDFFHLQLNVKFFKTIEVIEIKDNNSNKSSSHITSISSVSIKLMQTINSNAFLHYLIQPLIDNRDQYPISLLIDALNELTNGFHLSTLNFIELKFLIPGTVHVHQCYILSYAALKFTENDTLSTEHKDCLDAICARLATHGKFGELVQQAFNDAATYGHVSALRYFAGNLDCKQYLTSSVIAAALTSLQESYFVTRSIRAQVLEYLQTLLASPSAATVVTPFVDQGTVLGSALKLELST